MSTAGTYEIVVFDKDDEPELKGPGTDLILSDVLTPALVFGKPGGVARLLKLVADEVADFQPDMDTAVGRASIKAFAYKIARSKTAIDELGKKFGEPHYQAWKGSTAARNHASTYLDDLQAKVRAPLTQWENAEKARVDAHEYAIADINMLAIFTMFDPSVRDIDDRLRVFESRPVRDWEEYASRAEAAEADVRRKLAALREIAAKREVERDELARLRKEAEARTQKDRDDKIAADAAARAVVAAAAEKEALAKAKAEAEDRANKAVADKIAADVKAKADAKLAAAEGRRKQAAAVEAERQRANQVKADEEAATRLREANKKHRDKIHKAAIVALVEHGDIDYPTAQGIIEAIAAGKIPAVKVTY